MGRFIGPSADTWLAEVLERAAKRCENANAYPGDDASVLRTLAAKLKSGTMAVVHHEVQPPRQFSALEPPI